MKCRLQLLWLHYSPPVEGTRVVQPYQAVVLELKKD
jgi:hypothetical protein